MERKEGGGVAPGRLAALAGGGLGLVGFGRGVVENKVPRECSLALGTITVSRSMSKYVYYVYYGLAACAESASTARGDYVIRGCTGNPPVRHSTVS